MSDREPLTPARMDRELAKVRARVARMEDTAAARAAEFEQHRYARPDPPRRARRLVAATEDPVGDTVLDMAGADLRPFHRCPVVLWRHRTDLLPIGRAAVFVDGRRLVADVTCDRGDPLGREVDRKLRRGFLHALSIGYDTLGCHVTEDGIFVVTRWELTEVTVTPCPADRGATRQSPPAPGPLGRLGEVLGR